MARLANVKEKRHQTLWDTLIRTTGNTGTPEQPVLQSTTSLFDTARPGRPALTNLQVAGQLASDQTFVIHALRSVLYFNGSNSQVNYLRTNNQLYWTLFVGEKAMFSAPSWYFPAGGGTWGLSATPGRSVFNNGEPTQEAILLLAKPVIISRGQNFSVQGTFYPMGMISALEGLNIGAADDEKEITFIIDGLQARDVG